MNAAKILFPTDFSAASTAALELAASLARQRQATLLIVHVQEPPLVYGAGQFDYRPDVAYEDLLRTLKQIVPADAQIPVEHHLISGIPGSAIVEFATHSGVGLIVMATHGRTGLSRVLMGSVAEDVVRKATCPVITLKSVAATSATPAPVPALATSAARI